MANHPTKARALEKGRGQANLLRLFPMNYVGNGIAQQLVTLFVLGSIVEVAAQKKASSRGRSARKATTFVQSQSAVATIPYSSTLASDGQQQSLPTRTGQVSLCHNVL